MIFLPRTARFWQQLTHAYKGCVTRSAPGRLPRLRAVKCLLPWRGEPKQSLNSNSNMFWSSLPTIGRLLFVAVAMCLPLVELQFLQLNDILIGIWVNLFICSIFIIFSNVASGFCRNGKSRQSGNNSNNINKNQYICNGENGKRADCAVWCGTGGKIWIEHHPKR